MGEKNSHLIPKFELNSWLNGLLYEVLQSRCKYK